MSLVSRLYNVKTNRQRLGVCLMIIGSQMLGLTISDFGTESRSFLGTPPCLHRRGRYLAYQAPVFVGDWLPLVSLSVQDSWRKAVSTGVQHGIPMPCFTTALSFYDGYRHGMLPANLLQVRRPRGDIWPEGVRGVGAGRGERGELHRIKTVHVQLSPGCVWLAA